MGQDQLFRKPPDNDILLRLLEEISYKNRNGGYIIDTNVYKKMLFNNLNAGFCNELAEFYHESKQHYVTRPLTYKSFATILRQICKANNIAIRSRVLYIESVYSTEYTIHLVG